MVLLALNKLMVKLLQKYHYEKISTPQMGGRSPPSPSYGSATETL